MDRFNPEMLILAREANELSQAELAAALDISQGWLSKIEHGITEPTGDLVIRIAARLDFPVTFFYLTDRVYGLPQTFHRKRARASAKLLARVHAEVNLVRMHLQRLLKGLELEEAPGVPQFDVDAHGGPEEIARKVRGYWRLPGGPVRNLVDVIEAAGGIVTFYDFGTAEIDGIGVRDSAIPPLFFINSRTPTDRQRFTLAHELGHVVMHSVPSETSEIEAHRFAAEFLMPSDEIRGQFGKMSLERLATLKLVWRVSMASLLARARDVGAITESAYRYWNVEMSRAGFRTREPAELDLAPERPEFLVDVFRAYNEDLKYSLADLGKAVHDSVNRLSRIFPIRSDTLRLVS